MNDTKKKPGYNKIYFSQSCTKACSITTVNGIISTYGRGMARTAAKHSFLARTAAKHYFSAIELLRQNAMGPSLSSSSSWYNIAPTPLADALH